MRRSPSFLVMLLLVWGIVAVGQQRQNRNGAAASKEAEPPPAEDPALTTFKVAVEQQATDEQIGQFRSMVQSTDAALGLARTLRDTASNAGLADDRVRQATRLERSVDQALVDTRTFGRSLTDSQVAVLKSLEKKLEKSHAAIRKSVERFSEQLDQTRDTPAWLAKNAATFDKELTAMRTDQLDLARKMGIPGH